MEDVDRPRFLLLFPRPPCPLPVFLPPPRPWEPLPGVVPRPVTVVIPETVVAASSDFADFQTRVAAL